MKESFKKSENLSTSLTPLMRQYFEIKSLHQDKIVMFRLGDFFEMFHEDAKIAAPILNITLTARNKKMENHVAMCGVPHHSISIPISKLLAKGYKVALCDQVEDPKKAKGIVKRAVTRILSPGMVYDPNTLNPLEAHYIASFDENFVAFVDVSTGEAFYYSLKQGDGEAERDIFSFFSMLRPAEIVLTAKQKETLEKERPKEVKHFYLNVFEEEKDLGDKKEVFLKTSSPFLTSISAVSRLLSYVVFSQGEAHLKNQISFERRSLKQHMMLSQKACDHLEVFKTYSGSKKGSLFSAVNCTKTASGARLLRDWISFPLIHRESIEKRLNEVEYWYRRIDKLKSLRLDLNRLFDMERRIGKLSHPHCHPRDVRRFADSLRVALSILAFCLKRENKENSFSSLSPLSLDFIKQSEGKQTLLLAEEALEEIENTLLEESDSSFKEGGRIRKGLDPELDEWISLSEDAERLLFEMERKEKEKTQIPSLKIRYNNVFGYFIEITHKYRDQTPDHYVRRQTLTQAERFVTEELKSLETKILSAKVKREELERQIFEKLRSKLVFLTQDFKEISRFLSQLDVLSSFSWLTVEWAYVRPFFSEEKKRLQLIQSRHPVLEQEIKGEFISNNVTLNSGEGILLTGPNMAGKSTLMRQVALTALLAQTGSFVPAKEASLPLFKQIFTRVGASDSLSEGLSTFMVEMKETVDILNQADSESLVILDEIGRGTSTYDGLSLAQAILEFLVLEKKPYLFFATHYHELTELHKKRSQIHNYYMKILETKESEEKKEEILRFLYQLTPGSINKSYGIHVATLAGFPSSVLYRARELLKFYEGQKSF